MKEQNNEHIQSLLDEGLTQRRESLSEFEQEQFDGYLSLFQQLNTEPQYTLPPDFSASVSGRLKFQLKKRSDLRFNVFATLGIVLTLFAAYGLLRLVEINAANQFLLAVFKLKWVLLMGVMALTAALIFEQRVGNAPDTAEVGQNRNS